MPYFAVCHSNYNHSFIMQDGWSEERTIDYAEVKCDNCTTGGCTVYEETDATTMMEKLKRLDEVRKTLTEGSSE